MTTTCTTRHIAIYDRLLAVMPHALGFRPTESLVLAWLTDGVLTLTQRLDLPAVDAASAAAVHAQARAVVPTSAVSVSDGLLVVIVTDRTEHLDQWVALVDHVCALVHDAGVCTVGVLHVRAGRWRSLDCSDRRCCPPAGRPVDARAVATAATEAALSGRAVLPDREAVAAQVAPDRSAVAQVSALLPSRPRRARRGDAWRDGAIEDITALLLGRPGPVDADRRARVLRALADIRVRDTVLWEIGQAEADGVERAAVSLAALCRSAPEGLVAPVATCCAVAFWLTGDGAAAAAAVDRALRAEPRYGLAILVRTALAAGVAAGAVARDPGGAGSADLPPRARAPGRLTVGELRRRRCLPLTGWSV